MRRAALLVLLVAASCVDPHVRLTRGALGPASYRLTLEVQGAPTLRSVQDATMRIDPTPAGARLRLSVEGEPAIVAELARLPSGRFSLESVEGVPPASAGEADLASLLGQLDAPLPSRPVALGDTWTSARTIASQTLDAKLVSRMSAERFRRVGGVDALQMRGSVSGTLRAGELDGTVSGRTSIAWAVREGRLAASETELTWTVDGVGRVKLRTVVAPA